jgi:poly(3-hydroxybutyrate) depolymerase
MIARALTLRAVLIGVAGTSAAGTTPVAAQPADDTFAQALESLRLGPVHAADVPVGRIELTRANVSGLVHRYVLIVPEDYDPARRYPVAFYLHGGVSRPDPGPGGGWWRNYDHVVGHDRIAVLPLSWNESYWWQASQVENLRGILSEVKRTYNVDENRVYAFGSSDGGTGVYFLAFRDVTPWAAFLPFIGHPAVLMSPQTGVDGQMSVDNLTNRSFFIVNGETDPLYPVRAVMPFLDAFARYGVDFVFTAKQAGHTTSWWPEEEDNIERFLAAHPRDPHPERIRWATETTARYNRVHWVVIDEIGALAGDGDRAPPASLVPIGPTGGVDVVRSGNAVTVDAYHVRRFTLLISPDAFDLRSPLRVVANGDVVFEGTVRADEGTLRKWAAIDEDRTMLYAAEIEVELPAAP